MTAQKAILDQMNKTETRIKRILIKYKKGLKIRTKLVNVNSPVVFLMRRSLRLEFHEASKKNKLNEGVFQYIHSNGTEHTIKLNQAYCHTADIGQETFKAFIHHEDWAQPLPPQPLLAIAETQAAIENAMSAEMKWKAEEKKATAKQILAIAGVILALAGAYIFYKLVVPSDTTVERIIVEKAPDAVTLPLT